MFLLMMIVRPVSRTFLGAFRNFCENFQGTFLPLSGKVAFAERPEWELKAEGEIAQQGMDIHHHAGVELFIFHALHAA